MLFQRRDKPTLGERFRVGLWPRRSWRRSFAYYRHRILRLSGSPHAIAAGVAAGVFASFTPFVGFHFLLSFIVAYMIAGNMIAAAIGTAAGNPLTFPFIWVASFNVGTWVLGSDPNTPRPGELELSFDVLTNSFMTIWPTLQPMVLGGMIIGLFVGLASYFIVRSAVLGARQLRAHRFAAAKLSRADAVRPSGDPS
jgi:uncharacterized protein (DUF2062 family)